jgi:hypothetical protein
MLVVWRGEEGRVILQFFEDPSMSSAVHVHLRIVGHDGTVFTDCEILRLVKRGLPRDWGAGFSRHFKANVESCSGMPLIAGTPNSPRSRSSSSRHAAVAAT